MQSILVIMAVAATATAQLDMQNNINMNTGMNPHLQQFQQQQQMHQMQQMQHQQVPAMPMNMGPMMRQNKMMNFDSQAPAFNPHRYQGPFSPQFYPTNQNTFSHQQQQQQPIPVMGNTIDQTQGQGQTQGQLPFPVQTRLLTLQELIATPLFKEYMKYRLFVQFLPTTAFQLYLQSPLFQQYMTSPIFQMFFSDSAQFYQHVYPLLIQFQQRSGQVQGHQGQPQFQPQQYQPTFTNMNMNNNEIYPQATATPSPYLFDQNQIQGQGQGQIMDPMRIQRRYINRLRKRMLWNLIMAAQQQQQQQQPQPMPSPQFQVPAPMTFDPSQGQGQYQYQDYPYSQQTGPIPAPVQVQMIPQAQRNPAFVPEGQFQGQNQGQPEVVMMVVAEDQQAKQGDNSATKPEIQRTPALERFLLEKMLRAIFLQKMNMMKQQTQQSIETPEQRQIFIIEEQQTEPQQQQQQAKEQILPQGEQIQVRPQTIPIADLRKPIAEGQTETEMEKDTETETYTLGEPEVRSEGKDTELPTIMVRGEPITVDTTMEVVEPKVAATNTNVNTEAINVEEIEGKKKMNKKMKLMKILNAHKRFTKFNKNIETMNQEPTEEVLIGAEEKFINNNNKPEEILIGAEEKIINKMPVPKNDDEIMIPAPDFRARRQSQIQNQNQRQVMVVPANSPQFLQLMQMLQNRAQAQQQPQPQPQGQGQVFYRFNNLEGQNQFLGNENVQQPSRFHYTVNDQKNMEIPTGYETTGARGLYSVPLTQGQPIYGNGFNAGERYAMPSSNVNNHNNNYEAYSIA